MKKYIILAAMAALVACSQQKEASAPKQASLESDHAKLSYAIGLDVGHSLKELGADIDRDVFMDAVNTQLDGTKPRLAADKAAELKQAFFKKRAEKQAKEMKAQAEKNKVDGEKFLAENAKKDGVTVTDSGLQYEVITMGDGKKPVATDKVKVNYEGTTIDGKVFDSSYKRGKPITFPLNAVIKGWTEAVQLMPVGSKFKFYIPADLAYGEHGAGAAIAPNSTLIFVVELLGIEDTKAVQDMTPKAK